MTRSCRSQCWIHDQVVAEIERLEGLEKDAEFDLPPVSGSGTAAQAEEARHEEIAWLSTKRREARAYWRSVLDNLRDSRATQASTE